MLGLFGKKKKLSVDDTITEEDIKKYGLREQRRKDIKLPYGTPFTDGKKILYLTPVYNESSSDPVKYKINHVVDPKKTPLGVPPRELPGYELAYQS